MWINYRLDKHKITGPETREVLSLMQDGDIFLRRLSRYLNTVCTPGYYGHAAIKINGNDVAHEVSKGGIREDILEFLRCDAIAILHTEDWQLRETAAKYARTVVDSSEITPYDFDFRPDNKSLYCTEFVDRAYGGIFNDCYVQVLKQEYSILLPDNMLKCGKFKVIYEARH